MAPKAPSEVKLCAQEPTAIGLKTRPWPRFLLKCGQVETVTQPRSIPHRRTSIHGTGPSRLPSALYHLHAWYVTEELNAIFRAPMADLRRAKQFAAGVGVYSFHIPRTSLPCNVHRSYSTPDISNAPIHLTYSIPISSTIRHPFNQDDVALESAFHRT